jgi:hypothetical protein
LNATHRRSLSATARDEVVVILAGNARVARIDVRVRGQSFPSGSSWGPTRKRENFRAVARWMAKHPEGTIAGIDCNPPLVDLW